MRDKMPAIIGIVIYVLSVGFVTVLLSAEKAARRDVENQLRASEEYAERITHTLQDCEAKQDKATK